ncbi:MAG: hypothetical protein J6T10_21540 [Methanobrevibacter sp.]|nr:hypothetical protein [Methanobrevibacter sp.]
MKNSIIILCKNIKLDRDHKNVLSYSESAMVELCYQNEITHASNFSFIKEGKNEIEVPFTYAQCLQSNYIAFQNPSYSNKWFFAFVDSVEYRNDGACRLKFTVDNFATWYDYWDASHCFVIREHVSDDTVGLHTYPEGLEYGDYVINTTGDVETDLDTTMLICIAVSYLPDNTPFYTQNRVYGGVFSGANFLLFRFTESASKFIQGMADIGHALDVIGVSMMPLTIANVTYGDGWTTGNLGNQTGIEFKVLTNTVTPKTIRNDITLASPSTLNGYTPKNNKLFCYPYNCLTITNNAGTQAEYKYEDFINNTPIFSLISVPTMNSSCWLFPNNYKKSSDAKGGYNWGIPVSKYPTGSYRNDMYTNYLTQNGINLFGTPITSPVAHAIGGGLQALTSAITLNAEGIGSGLGQMFGAVQEQYKASMIPNQIGGELNSADVAFSYKKMSPTYYKMSIRAEYAQIIDDYFKRFGYKVNRIKLPNQVGRENFNFVQIGRTEDIAEGIDGVPALAMEEINNIYRNGVTIWHNHTNLGNFSVSNNITS